MSLETHDYLGAQAEQGKASLYSKLYEICLYMCACDHEMTRKCMHVSHTHCVKFVKPAVCT